MIVCSCNFIRERELRGAVRSGATRLAQAYKTLGCRVQCGQCLPYAFEVVSDELQSVRAGCASACGSACNCGQDAAMPLRKTG